MTHCHDFFRKWKREGNFCGLRKQDAREMDSYLTLVERISNEKTGLNSDLVFDKFTAGAARPIIRCKDPETETKALNYVIACLKRGEDVTGGDLQATVNGFMGKEPKPPAQMRTPEPAPVKESLPVTPKTLGDQIRVDEMNQADENQGAVSDSSGKVSVNSDKHVHPGPAGINPVIINDTYRESEDRIRYHCVYPDGCAIRDKEPVLSPELCGSCNSLRRLTDGKGRIVRESPFKTAAQVKAGIAGEMFPDHIVDANKTITPPALTAEEQKKAEKQHRIELAEGFIDTIKRGLPEMVRDILKEHPSWNTADVLYFGVQVLHERKGRV